MYEKAVSYASSDPEVALYQARKAAEAVCKHVFRQEVSRNVGKMTLAPLIAALSSKGKLPPRIIIPLKAIGEYGNFGSHDQGDEGMLIDEAYTEPALKSLATVVEWFFSEYCGIPWSPEDESRRTEYHMPRKSRAPWALVLIKKLDKRRNDLTVNLGSVSLLAAIVAGLAVEKDGFLSGLGVFLGALLILNVIARPLVVLHEHLLKRKLKSLALEIGEIRELKSLADDTKWKDRDTKKFVKSLLLEI